MSLENKENLKDENLDVTGEGPVRFGLGSVVRLASVTTSFWFCSSFWVRTSSRLA